MAQGKNNAAIAEALVVAERSVEKHVHAIFTKLGCRARTTSTAASRRCWSTSPRRSG